MSERKLFTSESVSEGHLDKIADQISKSYLDAVLVRIQMPMWLLKQLFIQAHSYFGEISTTAYVDINPWFVIQLQNWLHQYRVWLFGRDRRCASSLVEQSPDIAQGVNEAIEGRVADQDPLDLIGARQGLMFGFAVDETPGAYAITISLKS